MEAILRMEKHIPTLHSICRKASSIDSRCKDRNFILKDAMKKEEKDPELAKTKAARAGLPLHQSNHNNTSRNQL